MSQPVSYVEFNSPELEVTNAFLSDLFGWQFQPFAAPDYLVAPHGDALADLDAALELVADHGGTVAVQPFTIPEVGRGAYILDPTGLVIGLHAYDA
jgi:predicted enzyme related to lactoylglutathione lyase